MAASVQFRLQNRDLGMVMREVDEDLAIFLGIGNAEKQKNNRLSVEHSQDFDNSTGTEPMPDGLFTSNTAQTQVDQIANDDDIFKLENEGSDFDWLISQADTSLLPSVKVVGVKDYGTTQTDISKADSNSQESELACDQSSIASNSSSLPAKSTIVESSFKKPSSANRKPASRSSTPTTRRSSLPAKPKPSRAQTPTSRTTLPSSKPVTAQAKVTSRSSTPSNRPSLQPTSDSVPKSSAPKLAPDQALMVRKTGIVVLKNSTRRPSPMAKSRPSKPIEAVSTSNDAVQRPKTSILKRPASASRGRPVGSATNVSSSNGKPRQKSCSPPRVRVAKGTAHKLGSRSRGYGNGGDDDYVNPVLMGTQMVERVVNMRKLGPPKPDECLSHNNTKKSSKASGFGRSLSSRSLEMAVRHMDIRRSIVDGIRPVATNISSSSFGTRSLGKSGIHGASESPVTSSCDGSESSLSFSFGTRSLGKSGIHGASESPVTSSCDGSESSLSFNSRFADENDMDTSLNMKC